MVTIFPTTAEKVMLRPMVDGEMKSTFVTLPMKQYSIFIV